MRLEALLTRAQGRNPRKRLQVGDLVLDLATLEAQRGGQVLHLYPACRKLLEVLMRASPGAVTRQQLEFALWGDEPPMAICCAHMSTSCGAASTAHSPTS